MHILKKFYLKTLRYELINKFRYTDTKNLLKIKKITLNFGSKTADIKQLASFMLAFELIVNQKGILTTTKSANIFFKVRKGNPTGCKVTLQKFNLFNFLYKILFEVFPKLKNFDGFTIKKNIEKDTFSFQLKDMFSFSELEKQYYLFNNLPNLNIVILTNAKKKMDLIYLLKSFQFPLK